MIATARPSIQGVDGVYLNRGLRDRYICKENNHHEKKASILIYSVTQGQLSRYCSLNMEIDLSVATTTQLDGTLLSHVSDPRHLLLHPLAYHYINIISSIQATSFTKPARISDGS